MFCIANKLENIRREVVSWKKTSFRDIFKQKKEIEGKLDDFQERMARGDLSLATYDKEQSW